MHCDTIDLLCKDIKKFVVSDLRKNTKMVDLEKLKSSDYLIQCFAIFLKYEEGNLFQKCNDMIDRYYYELRKNRDLIEPLLDLNEIIEKDKIVSILTIEESAVIEDDISNIDYFYRRGVRMMTLCWNYNTTIASPNYVSENIANTKTGLTKFGLDVINRMERIGMIIDVSHLSDKGFYDVLNNTIRPFVASHSNSRTVYSSVRNLTDDMIIKMSERKCLIGINFYADFLSNKGYSYVSDIVKHINYINKLVGIDIIAIGTDFDGIPNNLEIKDASYMYLLIDELKKNDYSEEEIEKICYKNFLNFLRNYQNS